MTTNIDPLPPVPAQPLIVAESSTTSSTSCNPHTDWWCDAVYRPRLGDARVEVIPPQSTFPLLVVVLPADTIDDARETGTYALDIARHLVQLLAGETDGVESIKRDAIEELKKLLDRSGPMGGKSETAWHNLLTWKDEYLSTGGMCAEPLYLY